MSGEGKWKTVGGKKGGRSFQNGGETNKGGSGRSIGGLTESSTVFARFGEVESRPEGHAQSNFEAAAPPQDVSAVEGGKKKAKRPRSDKRKQQPLSSFQQRVKKLEYESLRTFLENTNHQFLGNTQGFLKALADHLREWFLMVEPENDYTFTDNEPDYPSSELDGACRDLLLSHLSSCPQLALEGMFRQCIDTMLADVKGHVPSYGTRVFLQLLSFAFPQVTTKCTERIFLLLASNVNRVPEALSLLWAGLPHPKLHPLISQETWSKLCLPVFALPNVPRQVVNFALYYSVLLLSNVGDGDMDHLCQLVPPTALCELLTSTPLTQRRAQKSATVQDLCHLLQAKLLANGLAPQYFSGALQSVEQAPTAELLFDFMVGCLSTDGRCFAAWRQLHPSHLQTSTVLLSHLHTHWGHLGCQLPQQPLRDYLVWLRRVGSVEERDMAKTLLDTLRTLPTKPVQTKGRGCTYCLCYIVLGTLAVAYLCLLGVFLVSVATEGPEKSMDLIRSALPSTLSVSQLVRWMMTVLSQLFDLLSQATEFIIHPA